MNENIKFEVEAKIIRQLGMYNESVLHIPNCCGKIGKEAFKGFENLQLLSLSDDVEVIGDGAFENCKKLKAIYITKNSRLRYIGRRSFAGTSVSNVMVPPDIEIEDDAFDDCPELIAVLEMPRDLLEDEESGSDEEYEDMEDELEYEDDSGGDDDTKAVDVIGDLIINLFVGG
ncbi:MAG: leucine-rich repeat domain-containing protein [Clostridiales bacterium]|nr:leucine-rich repeat domain-containing protein [Clostridiales bacterium]